MTTHPIVQSELGEIYQKWACGDINYDQLKRSMAHHGIDLQLQQTDHWCVECAKQEIR